jgi:transposase
MMGSLRSTARSASLLAKIDDLVEQNKALLARIAELEGRAGKPPKTPTNSSLPPSSGQKANVGDASTTKRSRKGHPGVARELCVKPDVTRTNWPAADHPSTWAAFFP